MVVRTVRIVRPIEINVNDAVASFNHVEEPSSAISLMAVCFIVERNEEIVLKSWFFHQIYVLINIETERFPMNRECYLAINRILWESVGRSFH